MLSPFAFIVINTISTPCFFIKLFYRASQDWPVSRLDRTYILFFLTFQIRKLQKCQLLLVRLFFAFVCMCTQIDDKLNSPSTDKKVEKPNAKHEKQIFTIIVFFLEIQCSKCRRRRESSNNKIRIKISAFSQRFL